MGSNERTQGLIDLLRFNGTYNTNRLYRACEKYVAVKKVNLMRKLTMFPFGNTQYTITINNSHIWSLSGKPFDMNEVSE